MLRRARTSRSPSSLRLEKDSSIRCSDRRQDWSRLEDINGSWEEGTEIGSCDGLIKRTGEIINLCEDLIFGVEWKGGCGEFGEPTDI